ncbi:MAG: M23 family metallopeptidase, partial [Bacteroidetes bacterium]
RAAPSKVLRPKKYGTDMRKLALLTGICLFILSFSFHPTFGPEPENLSFEAPGCPGIHDDTPAPALPTDPEKTKAKYPQNYFRSPVRHTIRLSGTFGELRPNHFHSGIDIKSSKGGIGDPVFAVADGYVARIKVQAGGYGNALYIRHPNGYTSVYAHLDRFAPELAKYVLEKQYERRSFAVDLYPEAGQFSFKKGAEIGKMGNSGSSQGPHLHFEMRDTRTQKPVNPLLFGFPMTDNRAPRMHQLRVYALNDKRETIGAKTYNLRQNGRQYRVAGDTLTIDAWRAGFALKVYDHHDFVTNWNGIYQLEMRLNDQPWYAFDLESFSFNETRYVNAHLDYGELVSKKAYFNRCFRLPGNQLSIYSVNENEGVVPLHQNQTAKISLIASDVDGNESRLDFWVKRGEVTPAVSPPYNYLLLQNEENEIETGQLFVHFPRGALYENLYMEYAATPEKSYGYYSNVHHIHNKKTPV